MFASNTATQDVTDAQGWTERGLKRTKASLDLHSEPSFLLVLPQLFGGVMLWIFSALPSTLNIFVFQSLGP